MESSWAGSRIWTIGHSIRTIEEHLALLLSFGVEIVADVRTVPRSRRNPQFSQSAMEQSLPLARLRYVHLPRLGGLRKPRRDSKNAGWENESFRGYADYMGGDEFEAGLAELKGLAAEGAVATMCAEAVPWRCHRSLLSDVLVARGAEVMHILDFDNAMSHRMTSFAKIDGGRVSYPPAQPKLF